MLKPVSTLMRVPAFEGTTATFIGTLRLPARNVTPRGERERHAGRRDVGTDAELRAFARAQADHPAHAGKRHALVEAAEQDRPIR